MINKNRTILFLLNLLLTCGPGPVFAQPAVDPFFEKIDFAHGLYQRGLYDMAGGEYQQFIDRFPDSTYVHEAYFGLAESHFSMGRFSEAAAVYQKYVNLFNNRDKIHLALLRLGECLLNLKKYDEAYSAISAINEEGLEDQWLQKKYLFLGQINTAKGKPAEAIKDYQKIEGVDDESPTAIEGYIKLGEIYKGTGDYPSAVNYFRKAVQAAKDPAVKSIALYRQAETAFLAEDYEVSADLFAEVVDIKSDIALGEDAVSNLLLALFNVPAYNAVVSRYRHYESMLTPEGRLFDARYVLSRSLKQLGQYDEALKEIDKALAVKDLTQDEVNKATDVKVEILFLSKRYQDVITLIDQKWKDQPAYAEKGLFFKAESSYSLVRFQDAHDLYNELLQKYPETTYKNEAFYGLAHAKNALGKETEAAELFEQYFSSSVDEVKKKEALYNQILLKSKMEQNDKALKDALLYLSAYPDDPNIEKIRFLLGSLYSKQKQYKEAVSIFEQIVNGDAKNPKREESLFLLAYNLQLDGNIEKAIQYYEKVPHNKENPSIYYSARKNLTLIYIDQKNFPRAILLLKEIINSYDQNDLTIDMYLWLAEKSLEAKAYDTVLSVLDKAAGKLNTDDDRQAVAYFKATAHQRQGQCDQAAVLYDTAIAVPNNSLYVAQAMLGKAQCLAEKQEYGKAKELLDKILLDFSADGTITLKGRFEMGNLLARQGKLEEAAKFYMLVAVLYNEPYYCPESLYQAGLIFEKTNKLNDARNVYQEIIQLYTGSHRFEEAQKRLAVLNP
ncbi:MAG: tetratricopeptide repeat protein [Candidatus Omnitrophota bacterium]